MKWTLIITASAAAAYLFFTKKGKTIVKQIKGLAGESKELKHYLGNIAGDIKQEGLAYGEDPTPSASTH